MDKTADMINLQTLLDRCSSEVQKEAPDDFLISHYLDRCQQLSDKLGYKLNTTQWFESGVLKIRCGIPSSLDFFIAWLQAEKEILERKRS